MSYPSNYIHVNAKSKVDLGGQFKLNYNAYAKGTYFVFNDVLGWSNKTGSRRTEDEQEGLLKGNIYVQNNLKFDNLIATPQPSDWLPCLCPSGNLPPFSQGSVWPSTEAISVLLPNQLLPNNPACNDRSCLSSKC